MRFCRPRHRGDGRGAADDEAAGSRAPAEERVLYPAAIVVGQRVRESLEKALRTPAT